VVLLSYAIAIFKPYQSAIAHSVRRQHLPRDNIIIHILGQWAVLSSQPRPCVILSTMNQGAISDSDEWTYLDPQLFAFTDLVDMLSWEVGGQVR